MDTETAAYFLTVSFITLGNGIFNPPKRSLHFESSLRLTENILKVSASWGQQIPNLENRLSQKNFHSSFKALQVLSATFTQGTNSLVSFFEPGNTSLQPMTSHQSDLISKFGNEIRKGRGQGPEGMRRERLKN